MAAPTVKLPLAAIYYFAEDEAETSAKYRVFQVMILTVEVTR